MQPSAHPHSPLPLFANMTDDNKLRVRFATDENHGSSLLPGSAGGYLGPSAFDLSPDRLSPVSAVRPNPPNCLLPMEQMQEELHVSPTRYKNITQTHHNQI
jgi:hypothetical protein